MRVTYYDGATERGLSLSYWDGTTEYALSSLEPMPYGYPTVSQMLTESRFYVGYHGGSADFPESSLYGFTQSVAWGIPALEITLARSVDGVLFGLDDQYLDRTALGAAGTTLDSTTMTWAEIQAYQITQFGQAKPYCRLADLLDAYLASHVLFIDPGQAYLNGFSDDLWLLLADYSSYSDRVVIKYAGTDTGPAIQAHAHGCAAYGSYNQTDDLAAMINTTGPFWDILGMDVNTDGTVDSAAWSAVLGMGKPVIGHTCSTTAMTDAAFSAGAAGVLVSGIEELYAITGPEVLGAITTLESALPFTLPARLGVI